MGVSGGVAVRCAGCGEWPAAPAAPAAAAAAGGVAQVPVNYINAKVQLQNVSNE